MWWNAEGAPARETGSHTNGKGTTGTNRDARTGRDEGRRSTGRGTGVGWGGRERPSFPLVDLSAEANTFCRVVE